MLSPEVVTPDAVLAVMVTVSVADTAVVMPVPPVTWMVLPSFRVSDPLSPASVKEEMPVEVPQASPVKEITPDELACRHWAVPPVAREST